MNSAWQSLIARPQILGDGAYGTALRAHAPAGMAVEWLNLTAPDVVAALVEAYVEAGAEVLWTNTFACALPELREAAERDAILRAGVRLAVDAAAGRATVMATLGPPVPGASGFESTYVHMAEVALVAGACGVVVETITDVGCGARTVEALAAREVKVLATVTPRAHGTGAWYTLCGTPLADAARLLEEAGATAVGVNCGDGPAGWEEMLAAMRRGTQLPLLARPNAGGLSPMPFAVMGAALWQAGAWLVGGCCGTTPAHVAALAAARAVRREK